MESFIEVLKVILPALITGIFTFIVTKYNYNRNVPLDNMKIAYNRIYYPIYKMIYQKYNDNMKNLDKVIAKIKPYLDKYNKYADDSTTKSFNLLCENKDKYSYNNFANNIYNKCDNKYNKVSIIPIITLIIVMQNDISFIVLSVHVYIIIEQYKINISNTNLIANFSFLFEYLYI